MNRLKKTAQERETRVYEIEGSPGILDQLEELFSAIEFLGKVGASREINCYVDGDGAVRLKFKRTDKKTDLKSKEINTDNDTIDNIGLC